MNYMKFCDYYGIDKKICFVTWATPVTGQPRKACASLCSLMNFPLRYFNFMPESYAHLQAGKEILGKIDRPQPKAAIKELGRGRLLFYVTFEGGQGDLNPVVFSEEILNGI